MANKELVDYIQKYHEKGYSLSTLKDFLLKQGYNEKDIEDAVSSSYTTEHKGHKTMYIALAVVAALIIIVSMYFLISPALTPKTYTLSITALPSQNTIEKGKDFGFSVRLTNLGTAENYPVSISYSAEKDGTQVSSGQRSVTSSSSETKFSFKPAEAGKYTITITTAYDDKSEESKILFTVTGKCGDKICEEEQTSCPSDCVQENITAENNTIENNTVILCGNNECDEGEVVSCPADCAPIVLCGNNICDVSEDYITCSHDCTGPVCGNNVCETTENPLKCPQDCKIASEINKLSELEISKYIPQRVLDTDATTAAQECSGLIDERKHDVCFMWVMKTAKQSIFCSYITDKNLKDDCYESYVFSNCDSSVCSEIQDRYKKDICVNIGKTCTK